MEKKYYRCKNTKCDRKKDTILTLGDLSMGCCHCGSREGFLTRNGEKGKWVDYEFGNGAQKLANYLSIGK